MNWAPVTSRRLAEIAYNHDRPQLYPKFGSGSTYCYRDIPRLQYQELLCADSKG